MSDISRHRPVDHFESNRALGRWIANGARLLTVTIAILLTIYKDRFWEPFDATSTHVSEWEQQELEAKPCRGKRAQ